MQSLTPPGTPPGGDGSLRGHRLVAELQRGRASCAGHRAPPPRAVPGLAEPGCLTPFPRASVSPARSSRQAPSRGSAWEHSRAREGVSRCPGCCGVQHIPEGRCHAGTPCAPCQLPTHAHRGAIKLSQVPPAAPFYPLPPLTRRHGMPGAMSCRGGGVGRLLPSRRARCPVLSEKLWGKGPCISSSSSALLKRW